MRHKSTEPPNAADLARFAAIKKAGCIVARLRGQGFLECDIHHLTITAGTMRRGHAYTIGLNPWSHVGTPVNGWSAERCYELLGPSLKLHGRAFKAAFGGDLLLLKHQNDLLGVPMPPPQQKRVSRARPNKTGARNGSNTGATSKTFTHPAKR